ncbi:hypothetical protein Bca52824_032927 [Brassica carinata]|uniref:Uncharacterized protein n=1 Tax=Brassica carinata TaxID=52824 RepID=A0A8X7V809_BRACI|nr:hypothetical protein Bca52824_032927 [Brassica carinata]
MVESQRLSDASSSPLSPSDCIDQGKRGRMVKAEECICWSIEPGRSKKTMDDGKELSEFQTMWSIKQQDLVLKERLSKIKLLDSLIAKQGPLGDDEEALKKKLINELMSN